MREHRHLPYEISQPPTDESGAYVDMILSIPHRVFPGGRPTRDIMRLTDENVESLKKQMARANVTAAQRGARVQFAGSFERQDDGSYELTNPIRAILGMLGFIVEKEFRLMTHGALRRI